jgi:hypothetical protein
MGVFTSTPRRLTRPDRPANPHVAPLVSVPGAKLPFSASRGMTAAAAPINLNDSRQLQALARRRAHDQWQQEAWEYFDVIGEIKYAFTLVSNVLSRIRLFAGELADPSQAPKHASGDTPGGAAAIAALQRLDSAFGGQPGLLRDSALNLSVAGECYLVQRPGNSALGIPESWDIRSTDELEINAAGEVFLKTRADATQDQKIKLPPTAFMFRIWRPHPRYSDEPDSSMRGILDACSELLLVNRSFRAIERSRLNAGLLYLPDGLSAASSPDPDVTPEETDDADPGAGVYDLDDASDMDDIEEALIEAMTTPIADESSASAVVPLLLRGPAELGQHLQHIKFERVWDAQMTARADKLMDRIMQGLDIPKDIVAGLANVKYTNAQTIDDSLIKSHIEPLAILLCDALTVGYLRPMLKSAGVSEYDLDNYVVWYDATDVTAKPNHADDATKGYEDYLISGQAWRREHGFVDTDAPTPTEVALRMMLEKGTLGPELVETMLQVFAPDVMERVRATSQANNPAPLPSDVANALGGQAPGAPPGAPADAAPPGTNTPGTPTTAADGGTPPGGPPGGQNQPPGGGGTIDQPQVIDPHSLV